MSISDLITKLNTENKPKPSVQYAPLIGSPIGLKVSTDNTISDLITELNAEDNNKPKSFGQLTTKPDGPYTPLIGSPIGLKLSVDNTISIQYFFDKIQSIINSIVEYIILVKTGLNSIFSYKMSITIIMVLIGVLIYYGIQNILFNPAKNPIQSCDMSGNPIIVNDSEIVTENNNFEIIMVYTLGWIGLIWVISIISI